MITKKDLEHIAWLSRLELSEEDKEKYTPKLNSVLDYFGELDEVDTEGVEPTYHVLQLSNVFRDDEPGVPAVSLSQEEALANAPKKQDGFFKAPRMM
ncbi:glutamyl-tRNA(Gln) and/or aspartyl-tRNA(Asn) amidotransferase, C subunit [Candidatus Methanoperedens nitroreducens]|uniref:Aspartyl/glutamyl-tRNA(Asn/Gln) amidotransferase subunit C n=1 Tax=Candidatus Methanoperedens nitratireducens TaxID=1392998 RepID=A0A062V991_9EURY|nr:Asp-tRNA(Asn)/Glu-tRNA(Gln) amidotransferase subunit GatC [Candidatus Methanoperedens nitroreducens]KCZ72324.1 glutamyl-tRNA(Gln) and/or aspartyl-tRNA(Asn) amidotransferase, C subunit [Candidatus Methanoperedens nitroreducens]MDJ1423742.1 Asp-tRNA(Asn)/Glu-tRNA(Gln) amidotransferase subunit GatC [Candidatus Methanoperedens sp.]